MRRERRGRNDRHFQTGIPGQLHRHDGLAADRLSGGSFGAVFLCPQPGLRSDRLWLLHPLPHRICAAAVCAGAGHAQPGRGAAGTHRPAAADQPCAGVGHRGGQVPGHVRPLCGALRGGRGDDPGPAGPGMHGGVFGLQSGQPAVLLSAGLRRHRGVRIPLGPDREPDHCGPAGLWSPAVGLSDAQPAQYVRSGQRGGPAGVHGAGRSGRASDGPALPQPDGGVPAVCSAGGGDRRFVHGPQRLAHPGVQPGAGGAVPVRAL